MFVSISPSVQDLDQTFCSLQFADRVKNTALGQANRNVVIANEGYVNGEFSFGSTAASQQEKLRSEVTENVDTSKHYSIKRNDKPNTLTEQNSTESMSGQNEMPIRSRCKFTELVRSKIQQTFFQIGWVFQKLILQILKSN
ncbi:hypothetical protein RFI_31343 [Reticulomyxa filosa]|uniref:Kinesin motor domain-containing protein n=1 Tax=Reticulomyxa filosa TaxID=46433 RepID=X6LVU1_RETFI|nr:hypothetical protein RFI_31343 [Reticulomyxa filosa]|eukprot:ETO06053.1 hypothetical protein RFI_31343 [Reticulomyxa filosa]